MRCRRIVGLGWKLRKCGNTFQRFYPKPPRLTRENFASPSYFKTLTVYGRALVNSSIAFLLDNKVGGGLHALNLQTGDEIWQTAAPGCNDVPGCSPAQSAAVTAIPGTVFSGGLDGHLRAYSAKDGRIVWDVDTKTEYRTVNGVAAHGGSIDGPGAVVVGATVYVNSGYRYYGTLPGNALLAFSVEGR